jgi:hypothetical protein
MSQTTVCYCRPFFVYGPGFIFVALPQAVAALSRKKVIDFSDVIIDFFRFVME